MAHVYFYGATRQVTGSQHVLDLSEGFRILIDCGTDMEPASGKQTIFGVSPRSVNVVILTHAHIDHSGLLPLLIREGFSGPVYCTFATYQLVKILLRDAARLNMKKFGRRRSKPVDYYDDKMVEKIWEQFIPVDFLVEQKVNEFIRFTFYSVGHLLGAASVFVIWSEEEKEKSILFSGDIGRKGDPLLPDPDVMPLADYLVCESTYGGRHHVDKHSPDTVIRKIIKETCVDQPGRLIVPAFSVGRTQAFLYILHRLRLACKLPAIPIFTDSPLARKSTIIYEEFRPFLNDEACYFGEEQGTLFGFDQVTYLPDINSAEQLRNYQEPCIILTSSGMVRGGKSEDHVMNNLQNPLCTILIIGYCAEGTLGYSLLNGMSAIRVDNEHKPINARIEKTDVLSGHADHKSLIDYVKQQHQEQLQKIFLVHGEPEGMELFSESLKKEGYKAVIPYREQYYQL